MNRLDIFKLPKSTYHYHDILGVFMTFNVFKTAVQRQFLLMTKYPLFRVALDKDLLKEMNCCVK